MAQKQRQTQRCTPWKCTSPTHAQHPGSLFAVPSPAGPAAGAPLWPGPPRQHGSASVVHPPLAPASQHWKPPRNTGRLVQGMRRAHQRAPGPPCALHSSFYPAWSKPIRMAKGKEGQIQTSDSMEAGEAAREHEPDEHWTAAIKRILQKHGRRTAATACLQLPQRTLPLPPQAVQGLLGMSCRMLVTPLHAGTSAAWVAPKQALALSPKMVQRLGPFKR
jgi:hypothetical protein